MLEQPHFGQRLKQLRTAKGVSQVKLAGVGISTGYLSRLESGARPPTERIVAYLAERLAVPVSAFHEPKSGPLAQVLAAVASGPDTDDSYMLLSDAMKEDDSQDPALRWQALWLLARSENRRGKHDDELCHLKELTTLGDELAVPELRTRVRTRYARFMRGQGDNDQARALASEAYSIAREHKLSVQDTAAALLVLISAEAEAGQLQSAQVHVDELCTLVDSSHGTGTMAIEALWAAAGVRIRQGNHAAAETLLEQALNQSDSRDDLVMWARLRLAAASLYLRLESPKADAARGWLQEAEQALLLVGTPLHRQELAALQAHLAFAEGRIADAQELCDRLGASDLLLSFRDRVSLKVLQNQILILSGQADEGIRRLQDLAREASGSLNVDLAAEIWRNLAETLAGKRGL